MSVRNRIKELRFVLGADLKKHPKNWRKHGSDQRSALEGIFSEVGIANALVARELEDGTLELIDGHLRADILDHQEIPVVVLDVNEDEANKLLLTIDPIGAMAKTDKDTLVSLLRDVQFSHDGLQGLLDSFAKKVGVLEHEEGQASEVEIGTSYQVIVDCPSEEQQREVYQLATERGLQCHVLTL